MAKQFGIKQLTEAVLGLGRLAFIGAIGLITFLALLMVGNFLLYVLAHVTDALFDLLRNGIFGS